MSRVFRREGASACLRRRSSARARGDLHRPPGRPRGVPAPAGRHRGLFHLLFENRIFSTRRGGARGEGARDDGEGLGARPVDRPGPARPHATTWSWSTRRPPATGSASWRVASTMRDIARVGPIRRQADIDRLFVRDPTRPASSRSPPEEMPVTETLEFRDRLREQMGMGIDTVVVNGLYPERFGGEDARRLAEATAGPHGRVSAAVRARWPAPPRAWTAGAASPPSQGGRRLRDAAVPVRAGAGPGGDRSVVPRPRTATVSTAAARPGAARRQEGLRLRRSGRRGQDDDLGRHRRRHGRARRPGRGGDDRPGAEAGQLARRPRARQRGASADPDRLETAGLDPRPAGGELWAMMLDAKRTFDQLVERRAPTADARRGSLQPDLPGAVERGGGLAGVHGDGEALRAPQEGRYDLLVLDTPPSRNALDFLDAPERLARFIDSRSLQFFLAPGRRGLRFLGRGTGLLFSVLRRVTGIDLLKDLSDFFGSFGDMAEGFNQRAGRVNQLLTWQSTSSWSPARRAIRWREAEIFFRRRLQEDRMPFGGAIVNRVPRSRARGTPPRMAAPTRPAWSRSSRRWSAPSSPARWRGISRTTERSPDDRDSVERRAQLGSAPMVLVRSLIRMCTTCRGWLLYQAPVRSKVSRGPGCQFRVSAAGTNPEPRVRLTVHR